MADGNDYNNLTLENSIKRDTLNWYLARKLKGKSYK